MRKTLLLVAAVNGAVANPVPEQIVGVKADPPHGIGTGVTIAIAPPGGIPKGCYNSWNGKPFGIAAVPIPKGKSNNAHTTQSEAALPTFTLPKSSPSAKKNVVDDLDLPAVTSAPALAGSRLIEIAAAAEAGEDVTITRRTTRTHTRTVTINSVTPSPAQATPVNLAGKKTIKAAQLYQIADGQIQAPKKVSDIELKPKPTASAGPSPTPFAPLPKNAPRISQIGDGQIQAPTVAGAKPAVASPSAAVPKPAVMPKAEAKPAAAPAPLAAPAVAPAPAASPAGAAPMAGMSHGGHTKRQATGGAIMGGYGCNNKDGSTLTLTLKNGVLKDKREWTGYIADNRQFQ